MARDRLTVLVWLSLLALCLAVWALIVLGVLAVAHHAVP